MSFYQLTYLISPEIDEPKSLHQKLIDLIQNQEGILKSKQSPQSRKLGYSIKPKLSSNSFSKAWVGRLNFYFDSQTITDLKQKILNQDQILRMMLIAKPEPKPSKKKTSKPSPKKKKKKKKKVELKDIDKKLDEILGSVDEGE